VRLVRPAASLTLSASVSSSRYAHCASSAGLTSLQKALGAETYAISHSDSKKKDCVERMGLDEDKFLVSHDPKRAPSIARVADRPEMLKDNKAKFDLIGTHSPVCALLMPPVVTNNQAQPPVAEYLGMCKVRTKAGPRAHTCRRSAPCASSACPRRSCRSCRRRRSSRASSSPACVCLARPALTLQSMIGSPHEIAEMLKLAHDEKLHSIIQKRPMKETGAALKDMQDGKGASSPFTALSDPSARYRYVLDAADSGL